MVQRISDAELEIMKIIWEHGERTTFFAYIMEELGKKGKLWQKNTLITLLGRLTSKGFLSVKKIGRKNEYTPLVSEAEYRTEQTQTFLDKIYEGNAKGLVSTLIQKELLSATDYEELRQFWEEEGKEK